MVTAFPVQRAVLGWGAGVDSAYLTSGIPDGASVYWDIRDLVGTNNTPAGAWTDRAGNHIFPAPGTPPTYLAAGMNGLPCVEFASANPLVCTDSIFAGTYTGFTWFAVVYPRSTDISSALDWLNVGNADLQTGTKIGLNGALSHFQLSTTGNPINGNWFSEGDPFGPQIGNAGKHRFPLQPMVIAFNYDGANLRSTLWIDGLCVAVSGDPAPASVTVAGGVSLGVLVDGFIANLTFRASGLAAYESSLSDSQMAAGCAALNSALIADNRPRIVGLGDSFGDGTAAAAQGTLWDLLVPECPTFRVINGCIPGVTQQVQASNVLPYNQLYSRIPANGIGVVWPGQIDIANGVSAATAYSYMASIVSQIQATGARAVVVTPIPKHYSADGPTQAACEAVRQSYITLVRANSAGADFVIDPTLLPEFSSPTAYLDLTYYTETGVNGHPTQAAYEAMLDLFADSLNTDGTPAALVFLTQPGDATVDEPFGDQPVVEVRDVNGVRIPYFSGNVTIAIHTGTGTLGGTLTQAFVMGRATFTDLEIDAEGSFVLRASIAVPVLTVDSASFDVESSGFNPSDYITVNRWLKPEDIPGADTDPISLWEDASAAGNDVTQAGGLRPTKEEAFLDGQNAARFVGASAQYLTGPLQNTGEEGCVFAVIQLDSNALARMGAQVPSGASTDFTTAEACLTFYSTGIGGAVQIYRFGVNAASVLPTAGTPFLIAAVWDGAFMTIYINGVAGTPVASTGNFDWDIGLVGAGQVAGVISDPITGYIMEHLVGTTAPDGAGLTAITEYFQEKYPSTVPPSAIELVSATHAASSNTNNVTSPAIDTTGATLLVAFVASYNSPAAPPVSDSNGNFWTALSEEASTGSIGKLWYSIPTTVGSGHTFTATGTGTYPSICVAAFSGTNASPFDQSNGDAGTGITTLQPGPITPTQDNSLIVTGVAVVSGGGPVDSINEGFTIAAEEPFLSTVNFGSALAYLVQMAAAETDPTWTQANASELAAKIASFLPE